VELILARTKIRIVKPHSKTFDHLFLSPVPTIVVWSAYEGGMGRNDVGGNGSELNTL